MANINKRKQFNYCAFCDFDGFTPSKLQIHQNSKKHKNLVSLIQSYNDAIENIDFTKYYSDIVKFTRNMKLIGTENNQIKITENNFLELENLIKSCPLCEIKLSTRTQIIDHI